MPYIVINSYPRDEKTKQAMAEKVSAAMQEALGCPDHRHQRDHPR